MIGRLPEALLDFHARHRADGTLPTNGPFLFYELEMAGLASKKKLAPGMPDADDVSDALTSLRDWGEIPWEDIVDETGLINDYTGYDDLAVAVLSYLEYAKVDYRRDGWPLILTESRSLAGTLTRLPVSTGRFSRRRVRTGPLPSDSAGLQTSGEVSVGRFFVGNSF